MASDRKKKVGPSPAERVAADPSKVSAVEGGVPGPLNKVNKKPGNGPAHTGRQPRTVPAGRTVFEPGAPAPPKLAHGKVFAVPGEVPAVARKGRGRGKSA